MMQGRVNNCVSRMPSSEISLGRKLLEHLLDGFRDLLGYIFDFGDGVTG